MIRSSTPWLLLLAGACLAACAPTTPDAASASASASASGTVAAEAAPAQRAIAAPCSAGHAGGDTGITSKVRHVPSEDDPCADSHGVAHAAQQ